MFMSLFNELVDSSGVKGIIGIMEFPKLALLKCKPGAETLVIAFVVEFWCSFRFTDEDVEEADENDEDEEFGDDEVDVEDVGAVVFGWRFLIRLLY